jgi:hypothetical protein
MLFKAHGELLGNEVLARDGRFGALENIYFDRDCWQVCYLMVAAGATRVLVSVGCIEAAAPARGRVSLTPSREQLIAGVGAWPIELAAQWLDDIRVCSVREARGWRIVAEDGPAGQVADLLVDVAVWSIDYLVATTGDAFGPREVLVPLDWADPLDPREAMVRMRRTRAQLSSAPPF